MINGYEFWNGPWHDVEWLIGEMETFYAEKVVAKGLGDRYTVTEEKIIAHRKWEPSLAIIQPNFAALLRELNIFYLPKQVDPGPAIVFPQMDIHCRYTYGKIRPFYELVLKAGPAKYCLLGKKENAKGPTWFGNTDQTLVNIGRTRSVVLVEGYFDLLACRLLLPETPVLSTGTKSVNDDHIAYLRMLGVKNAFVLFDNELPKEGRTEGAGNQAARIISSVYSKYMEFTAMECRNNDPAMCLEDFRASMQLKNQLLKIAA